jgi:hypothetical protein
MVPFHALDHALDHASNHVSRAAVTRELFSTEDTHAVSAFSKTLPKFQ